MNFQEVLIDQFFNHVRADHVKADQVDVVFAIK